MIITAILFARSPFLHTPHLGDPESPKTLQIRTSKGIRELPVKGFELFASVEYRGADKLE